MPRLKNLSIEGFRSIKEELSIRFPENIPVVIIGENNSGKSNVIRALELMFGEFHPKYKKLDDFDHYQRDPNNGITIKAEVSGFSGRLGRRNEYSCGGFKFRAKKGIENDFVAIQYEDGGENPYVSTSLREELLCVVVSAEQNLNYQLSYSSKFTLLSKVTKAFHDKLVDDPARVEKLKELFENIRAVFSEVEEFEQFQKGMSSIASSMLSNMSHALEFDFSAYDPSNYFKTLRVLPTEGGNTRAFEELGTGQQQILALSFAYAYAKSFLGQGLVFVLDEPESHLHPLAQKWLAKKIFKMAEDGLQIVITTHSPHFIELIYFEGVNLIRKDEEGTFSVSNRREDLFDHCIKTAANPGKTKLETVVPFYANQATPHILSGFFAHKIILVEGLTEELALPIFFERLGFDPTEFGISIIAVNGKGNLAKWWRLFTLFKIPTFICFDNDSKNDSRGDQRKDALKAIGILEKDLDGLLTVKDWNVSNDFCVFGVDFETTMSNSFPDYSAVQKDKTDEFGTTSKHIVAKETAKSVDLESETEGKKRLFELVEKIKNL